MAHRRWPSRRALGYGDARPDGDGAIAGALAILALVLVLFVRLLYALYDLRRHDAAVGMSQEKLATRRGNLDVSASWKILGRRADRRLRHPLAGDAHAVERDRHAARPLRRTRQAYAADRGRRFLALVFARFRDESDLELRVGGLAHVGDRRQKHHEQRSRAFAMDHGSVHVFAVGASIRCRPAIDTRGAIAGRARSKSDSVVVVKKKQDQ